MPTDAHGVPEVGVDYGYLRPAECEDKIAVLLQEDRDSKAIRQQLVESKGLKREEAIEAALRSIRESGHRRKIALKAESENAVMALKGEVSRRLDGGGFPVHPAAHEHESNGGVENSVKIFNGLFRVHFLALEQKIRRPTSPLINPSYVGSWSSWVYLLSECLVSINDKTECKRLFGKKVRGEHLEFDKIVLWRKPQLQDYNVVAEARLGTGVWVSRR